MTEYKILAKKLPVRKENSHKGDFGTLTVIGGSSFYRGAPALNICAALRCGVGIVRLASTERVIASVSASVNEAVYLPLKENDKGGIDSSDFISRQTTVLLSSSVLVGCGMTASHDTETVVSSLLSNAECPIVIDADGLNSIKTCPERLKNAKVTPIITPHIGEMSRLTGLSVKEISENPLTVAKAFSSEYKCVTVLKDSVTVITDPSGEHYVYAAPNSGLAKGGSGDVLSGMIVSLCAQGIYPYDAAQCGVILHGLAGRIASESLSAESMLPTDIISHLPDAYKEIRKERLK